MNKLIREAATTVSAVTSAALTIIITKWFYDTLIKKDKRTEKETEENDEA